MNSDEIPLDTDELMNIADRIERLPPADAEWVARLFEECVRSRKHEAELLSGQALGEKGDDSKDIETRLAQVALDAAEWLKTLWNVGYMGAGRFPSQPRSAFPLVELEDVLKSALFARIREGKRPLPFPPPTRHGLPWHDLIESPGEAHAVSAEIVRDSSQQAIGAIIEGCANWNILEEIEMDRDYLVQHQGKGAYFKLIFDQGITTLRQAPPRWTRRICLQERGGFQTYTLEWTHQDGRLQNIALRAATWERAEAEAGYWIATKHPEMYGQVSFERFDTSSPTGG